MAPVPLEVHQAPMANLPQEGNRGGSISLEMLIDFIVQRTYHELTVLAELLPRKTDMERKIEVYNFSARTRQLFVRLLALVKWASSAAKVEKSAHITSFLDKHSLLFVDTANILAKMARETLVHARLPNFHLPATIEVLTTGSYNRLPACIREKIVPPDPITTSEKKSTLQRLNQVIQQRLVTGNLLPQMTEFEIDAGRVTFRVEQEFSVSLTVMGDGPDLPWRLLDLEILVSDRETGDGKSLVHPLQTQYIHRVVQARLSESSDPLTEVYHILHYFCQSVQLEVLYSQTLRLMRDRLDDHVRIDKYVSGECLTISYWKELTNKNAGSELGYKLSVLVDQRDQTKPLAIIHKPSLANKECEFSDLTIKSNQLSMEYLLVRTIYIRTRNRLTDLKQELQSMFKGVECTIAGSPAVLSVPVLQPCLRAELLLIAVDTHTGMLQCHIPQYDAPIAPELTAALNDDHSKLPVLISELRFWITKKRCEKTLQYLPATPHEKLPLLYQPDHPITSISKHRVFVQFHRHPTVILIVTFKENELLPCEIQCSFYLCAVKPSSTEPETNDDNIETKSHNVYLKLESLIEFDPFVVTHGSFTSIDCESSEPEGSGTTESGDKGRKRRYTGLSIRADANGLPQNKKTKSPAYLIPELAHVVALCDEQIPFVMLAQELTKREIAHQGLQIEANATALVLKLIQLPPPSTNIATTSAYNALLKKLLSVAIRAQNKGPGKTWLVEFVFYGSPLTSSHPKEQGLRRPVYFQYEMGTIDSIPLMVDSLLNDWTQIVHLYSLVHDLSEYYKTEKSDLRNTANIKSYNYSKLILSYGPSSRATVTIQYDGHSKSFQLRFGKSPSSPTSNPHSLLKEHLESHLNRAKNLAQTIHILNETLEPLTSISKLPSLPQLGLYPTRAHIPAQTFVLMPQSVSSVRMAYRGVYCLELGLRGDGQVSLRDGAYSRFEQSNVVEGFTPIQGLSGFLARYADKRETASVRRSQCEDDNPPSPMAVDGSFLHPPPSVGSNPHTPASPYAANVAGQGGQQQYQGYGNSPAGMSMSLASPASCSTPNQILPHPSPGASLVAGSPLMPISSPGQPNIQLGHSPASSFMHGLDTGGAGGSPFPSSQSSSMASPGAATTSSNWLGSPSVSRPSPVKPPGYSPQKQVSEQRRVLPQRSWAGAIPTIISYETLELLCCNVKQQPVATMPGPDVPPLERFLGCVYLMRQLKRFIQANERLAIVNSTEPGVIHFNVLDTLLQCRISLNPQSMQSLHIKIQSIAEQQQQQHGSHQLSYEELQVLEKFFDSRAVAPPYKPNTLLGFVSMLSLPLNVLKNFLQIMRLELIPALAQQLQMKWAVQLCLRVPPSTLPIPSRGMPAVVQHGTEIRFYLQLGRPSAQPSRENEEPLSLVLPLVFDARTNLTQLSNQRENSPEMSAVALQLARYAEYSGTTGNSQDCSIFAAVRHLLVNLTLPSEQIAAGQQQQQQMSVPVGPGSQQPPQGVYRGPGTPMSMMGGGPQ